MMDMGYNRKLILEDGEEYHGGVEYDLQYLVTGVSKSESIVFFTIFQNQFSVIAHVHHC